jgi:hypothetical protein
LLATNIAVVANAFPGIRVPASVIRDSFRDRERQVT